MASARDTFLSNLVYASVPFSIQYSLWAVNHSVFNLFFVALFLCVLRVQAKPGVSSALLAGVAAYGLYMTRVEGIAFAFLLALSAVVLPCVQAPWDGIKRKFYLAVLFIATVIVLSIPFWVSIWKATGSWTITYVSHSLGAWQSHMGEAMMFWEPQGEGGWWQSLFKVTTTFGRFYLKDLNQVHGLLPRIMPLVMWCFVSIGMAKIFLKNQEIARRGFLLLYFALMPLFFYPIVSVEARRLYPSVLVFIMPLGAGIGCFYDYLKSRFHERYAKRAAGAACISIFLFVFAPGHISLLKGFKEEPAEQKQMGEWIRERYQEPKIIFASDVRSSFYAGERCKRFISMAEGTAILRSNIPFDQFIKESKVDLIVVDTRYIPVYYPAFQFLLDPASSPALHPVVEIFEGKNKIILYQVNPEQPEAIGWQ